tara:strand:- start:547 stop:1221 length:675 start_codon:yes stop_codon:yes gene_type:complete
MQKNYHTKRDGTRDGETIHGHLHDDNNLSAAMVRSGHDLDHYITLDATGPEFRKNSTLCNSPGSFQVRAGLNPLLDGNALEEGSDGSLGLASVLGIDASKPGNVGIFLDCQNGDIVLRAPKGRIRMEAIDVHIKASGSNNERGVLTLEGNEKVIVSANEISVSGKASCTLFSEKTVDLIGRGILNIYGGLVDVADGATTIKRSKPTLVNLLPTSNESKNSGLLI